MRLPSPASNRQYLSLDNDIRRGDTKQPVEGTVETGALLSSRSWGSPQRVQSTAGSPLRGKGSDDSKESRLYEPAGSSHRIICIWLTVSLSPVRFSQYQADIAVSVMKLIEHRSAPCNVFRTRVFTKR